MLLIGIAGTMQLQVHGIMSNTGGRVRTDAYQLARELTQALSQLPPDDPLLSPHFTAAAPPVEFGYLLANNRNLRTSLFTEWADGMPLTGVSTDADVYRAHGPDPENPSAPLFKRRWQVWRVPTATAGAGGINVIAVSVIYREPRIPGLKEAYLLTQVSNTGLGMTAVAAFR